MDLKSVPVLPSLITLGNVFFGFLAMAKVADAVWLGPTPTPAVIAIFETAVLLVLGAMVLDALDGRVARMTGQTTAFGAQLDSLADVVTFGVAPAFLAKLLINFHDGAPVEVLPAHPKLYYFCAAIYVLSAAMRLARYNVEAGPEESDHTEFKGLPTPGAAAMVCALVAFFCGLQDPSNVISRTLFPGDSREIFIIAMPATLVCLGLLMVSKLPYPHMFYTIVRRRHSFPFLATLVVLIGIAAIEWQLALLATTTFYTLSGFGLGTFRLITRGRLDPPSRGGGASSDVLDDAPPRVRRVGEPRHN